MCYVSQKLNPDKKFLLEQWSGQMGNSGQYHLSVNAELSAFLN